MMNLYSRKYDKDYGEIGTETNLIDVDGEPLFIGDLVLLTDDSTGIGRLRFVAHDFEFGTDYVMGAYLQSVGLPSGRNATWKKIAGYQNFTNGFQLNELEFVDSLATNKRLAW